MRRGVGQGAQGEQARKAKLRLQDAQERTREAKAASRKATQATAAAQATLDAARAAEEEIAGQCARAEAAEKEALAECERLEAKVGQQQGQQEQQTQQGQPNWAEVRRQLDALELDETSKQVLDFAFGRLAKAASDKEAAAAKVVEPPEEERMADKRPAAAEDAEASRLEDKEYYEQLLEAMQAMGRPEPSDEEKKLLEKHHSTKRARATPVRE